MIWVVYFVDAFATIWAIILGFVFLGAMGAVFMMLLRKAQKRWGKFYKRLESINLKDFDWKDI